MEISSTLLERLLGEAANSPDREICGLLFGTAERIADAVACRNVAPDPRDSFEIDPAQLIAAHRAERGGGSRLIGCYHSHPAGRAEPSPRDALAAAPDESIWLIVAGGKIGWYRACPTGRYHDRFELIAHRIVEAAPCAMR